MHALITALIDRHHAHLRISAVIVEYVSGQWQARVSYCNYAGSEELSNNLPQHIVSVDKADVPDGISVTELNRWPDETIPLPDIATDEQAEALIADVAKAGRAPDYAGFGEAPARRWITKPATWGWEEKRS